MYFLVFKHKYTDIFKQKHTNIHTIFVSVNILTHTNIFHTIFRHSSDFVLFFLLCCLYIKLSIVCYHVMRFLLPALFISLCCKLWNETRSFVRNKTSRELNDQFILHKIAGTTHLTSPSHISCRIGLLYTKKLRNRVYIFIYYVV